MYAATGHETNVAAHLCPPDAGEVGEDVSVGMFGDGSGDRVVELSELRVQQLQQPGEALRREVLACDGPGGAGQQMRTHPVSQHLGRKVSDSRARTTT
jgi:hypothetical protein